ncbi:MAG: tyrosine-type recombinase/integrase [Candidatus Bathyarchaeales archaeon]
MIADIHDYVGRLRRAKERLSHLEDSSLLLSFIDHLSALGLSTGRVAKYANLLCSLMRNCPFDPAGADRQAVERVIAWINSQPYKSSTKEDLKILVRKLVQYAKYGNCGRNTPVPPEVSWFSIGRSEKDSKVKPEMLLSIEDVKAIINAAENERDKALISVLFEAALRPSELLTMKVRSVEFNDNYCLISACGKTGVKRIPLVVSYKLLLDWLMKHPKRHDPDAPLWVSLSNNSKSKAMSYYYFRKLVKRLAEKAGLKREIWPYLFRHSCLTALAKILTESKLELYAGWVHGSKMARRYVHFSARDLEETVLEIHGLKEAKHSDGIMRPVECPRCKHMNTPNNARCEFCGYILDRNLAMKIEQEEHRRNEDIVKMLEEAFRRLERLEKIAQSILSKA